MNAHTPTKNVVKAKQMTDCEFELNNFFNCYPIELIEDKILKLFESDIPYALDDNENYSVNSNYLFYEELNLALKNCRLLLGRNSKQERCTKSLHAVILFIREVLPISYMFCTSLSARRTDLIIVLDQHRHKKLDEAYTLLDFAVLGHEHINCTVYTYGTIYELLSKGHLYFSSICTRENCVYQSSPTFSLLPLNQIKCNELISKSSHLFTQNILKARTFLSGARQFANERESAIAAFMLQQACELTYRGLLLSLRGKDIKCHDLVVLRKHLSHFVPTIMGIFDEDDENEIAILTSIQQAYIDSRYNQTYKIALAEVNKFIIASTKLIQAAQEIYNYHCQKLKLLAYSST